MNVEQYWNSASNSILSSVYGIVCMSWCSLLIIPTCCILERHASFVCFQGMSILHRVSAEEMNQTCRAQQHLTQVAYSSLSMCGCCEIHLVEIVKRTSLTMRLFPKALQSEGFLLIQGLCHIAYHSCRALNASGIEPFLARHCPWNNITGGVVCKQRFTLQTAWDRYLQAHSYTYPIFEAAKLCIVSMHVGVFVMGRKPQMCGKHHEMVYVKNKSLWLRMLTDCDPAQKSGVGVSTEVL